jgi:hypothetical protein
MNYKKLTTPLTIFTIISWTALVLVLIRLEPCITYSTEFCDKTSSLALILFYASLFFALTSSFTLIGFLGRVFINNNEVFSSDFNASIRQAILISISIISCLALLAAKILTWWLTTIIFGTILTIELYFFNQDRRFQ